MARIRTIKPEFFQHDGLIDLPRDVRLLFIGLWTVTDREGRVQDRPKRLRLTLFPGDADVTSEVINGWLWQLAEHPERFIVRYEVDGERFIEVGNFTTHQRPHPKESLSEIPASDSEHATVRCREEDCISREKTRQASLESEGRKSRFPSSIVHSPLSKSPLSSPDPESDARAKRRKRPESSSRTVPDDFEADSLTLKAGVDAGLDQEVILAELSKFRDHEFKTPHTDWQKAARNWLRRSVELKQANGVRAGPRFAAEVTAENARRLMAESIAEDEQERLANHDKS